MSNNTLGFARCVQQQDGEISIRFHRIGRYERFIRLVDDFKTSFPDRCWHQEGWWIIPTGRYADFTDFCTRHGLQIRWDDTRPKQLTLW